LAISKQLAELMDGEVGFKSEDGKGSTFWFKAVFEKSQAAGLKAQGAGVMAHDVMRYETRALQPVPRDLQPVPCRILLAEDNISNQKVALAILKRFGFSADIANNGREALELLKKISYDLVLMDMQMPEIDGIQATRIIRNPGSCVLNPNIPIIAMTANATREDRNKCADAGMNDYISKPINPDELLSVISKQLSVNSEQLPVNSEKLSEENKIDKSSLITDTPTTEIFDYQALLERIGGDKDFLKHLLKDFPIHLASYTGELKSALNEQNSENIRIHAHTIKGMCANMSARRLSESANRIEVIGKQGGTDIAVLLEELEQESEALRSVLSDMFPDIFLTPPEPQHDAAEESLTEEAKKYLPELIHSLENEIIPKWNKIRYIFYIDDAAAFATELKQIADTYHTDILSSYSKKLQDAVSVYDIDKIENIIDEFSEIVDKIYNQSI